MGGPMRKRLERLESRRVAGRAADAGSVHREVLRRMTDEELDLYKEALERSEAVGKSAFEDRDLPIIRRVEELVEEVRAGWGGARERRTEGEAL